MRQARLGRQSIEREVERIRTLLGISPDLVSPLLALPALRGLWVTAMDSGGVWYDASGHGHTLSYNGNPTFNYSNLVGYWDYDGAGDYHNRLDEADLDISGTETYVASAVRGLTWGGWFYPGQSGVFERVFGKWAGAGQRSYDIWFNGSQQWVANISDDGTNSSQAISSAVAISAWYLVVARFIPGSSVDIFVGSSAGLAETNQATARASVWNSNADLVIGAGSAGGNPYQGRAAYCFLCAAACSDAMIGNIFTQQRAAFL